MAVPDEAAFVIVHSEAPRLLTDTPYATRRAECERAAHILGRPLGLCELGDLSALAIPCCAGGPATSSPSAPGCARPSACSPAATSPAWARS